MSNDYLEALAKTTIRELVDTRTPMTPIPWVGKTAERFWRKVDASRDCWIWRGAKKSGGNGHFSVDGKNMPSHRFSYELFVGPVPDGMVVVHLCDHRACVRPDHLKCITKSDLARNHRPRSTNGNGWSGSTKSESRNNPTEEEFWLHVDKGNACWEWTGPRSDSGYGQFRGKRTHRLSYEMANGPIPKGLVVRHDCDNRACVRPDHLRLGEHVDNVRDRVERDRTAQGSSHYLARLTEDDVHAMRKLYSDGSATTTELAHRYGVTPGTISSVLTGRTWKHVS